MLLLARSFLLFESRDLVCQHGSLNVGHLPDRLDPVQGDIMGPNIWWLR